MKSVLNRHWSVIVAMIAVGMMQVTINQIIDMVAVGYRFVTTVGSVNVFGIVTDTVVCGSATVGIGVRYLEHMLFHLPVFSDVVQVAVVQIIYVIAMLNTGVFAIGSMFMVMRPGWPYSSPQGSVHGVLWNELRKSYNQNAINHCKCLKNQRTEEEMMVLR